MEKDRLLFLLQLAKNNYVLGLAASSLFTSEKIYPILDELSFNVGTYTLEFAQVADLLRVPEGRDKAISGFMRMFNRNIVREPFEFIKSYCEASNQTSSLTNQSWYQFARVIYNCFLHCGRFEFDEYDRDLLPISWRGHSITFAMDGTSLKFSFFGYVEAWELFEEMESFAKDTLV